MKNYKIYTLKDPFTEEIRYIGVTTVTLNARLSQHIYDSKKLGTHKRNWIKSITEKGKRPIIKLLEECTTNNWEERETYWISRLENLTNTLPGGKGVIIDRSKSSIQKSSESKYVQIVQLKEDGSFIKEWKSPTIVSKELDISKTGINNCLNKRTVLSGGYRWVYKDEYNSPSFKLRKRLPKGGSKIVEKYIEGKTISDYVSVMEAAKENNVFHTSIRRACKTGKKCKGYYYRYRN